MRLAAIEAVIDAPEGNRERCGAIRCGSTRATSRTYANGGLSAYLAHDVACGAGLGGFGTTVLSSCRPGSAAVKMQGVEPPWPAGAHVYAPASHAAAACIRRRLVLEYAAFRAACAIQVHMTARCVSRGALGKQQ